MKKITILFAILGFSNSITFGQRIPSAVVVSSGFGLAGLAVHTISNIAGTVLQENITNKTTTSTNNQIPKRNQVNVNTSENNSRYRKVQVAILLDASSSMDGMLNQAKTRIWNIVNELNSLKYDNQTPTIEIALYKYGMEGNEIEHVKQLLPLSNDLDLLSQQLNSIKTSGGDEYCGSVVAQSLEQLNWSSNTNDLKMIYVIGNEAFNQGDTELYKLACNAAVNKNIYVNTVFCGDKQTGINDFWLEAATMGNGEYFNISQNLLIQAPVTPFDDKINSLNTSLNNTYFGLGVKGENKKFSQSREDQNALTISESNLTERVIAKSSSTYSNPNWDIIDAYKAGLIDLKEIRDEDLPKDFQGKTIKQKEKLIQTKQAERETIQKEIQNLAISRTAFIKNEIAKTGNTESQDFGNSINQSILKKAEVIGLKKNTL